MHITATKSTIGILRRFHFAVIWTIAIVRHSWRIIVLINQSFYCADEIPCYFYVVSHCHNRSEYSNEKLYEKLCNVI